MQRVLRIYGSRKTTTQVERLMIATYNIRILLQDYKLCHLPEETYIYNSCVLPDTTYGAVTWTFTKQARNKLAAAKTKMERSMLNITYTDRTTNIWVRERTKVIDIIGNVRKTKLSRVGQGTSNGLKSTHGPHVSPLQHRYHPLGNTYPAAIQTLRLELLTKKQDHECAETGCCLQTERAF